MSTPYTSVSITDYNANPPSDDATEVASNQLNWSKHKTKLGDPLKDAIESINTNVIAAVAALDGGITSTAVDYTVLSSDQGKLIRNTGSGKTITTPDATSVDTPFAFGVVNGHATSDLTVDGNGSQTIDGLSSITLRPNEGVAFDTDGSNWFTRGRFVPQVTDVPAVHVDDYTLVLTDADKPQRFDDGSGGVLNLTIPTNASVAFPIGAYMPVINEGTGDLNIVGDTGVTLNGTSAGTVTIPGENQYDATWLLKVAADEWIATGLGAAT